MTDVGGWSVQAEYHDASGRLAVSPRESLDAVDAALAGDDEAPGPLILHPGDALADPIEVLTEDGRSLLLEGSVPADAPLGYHSCATAEGPRSLVISPARCHLPPALRLGGWALQLATARSVASWGIGDLADLRSFGEWAGSRGAGFTLVSPLNAPSLAAPIDPSPYLPTSRRWRNPLHLRVEEVAGAAAALDGELEVVAAAGRALNASGRIDRDAVAALKLAALRRVAAAGPLPDEFWRWRAAQGEDLERFAVFSVLAEEHGGDFRRWPGDLQAPGGAAVTASRGREAGRVTFHAWLQWLIEQQLAAAAAALPLLADLPIGVDPGGADVWADPDLFARDFSVGAPPDEYNLLGQDWAQPPWNPHRLRARDYRPLAAVLRSAFSHAMGLRIDHVMGLFRLFWIPAGAPPGAGVYVRYPAADLLDIVALESTRAQAVVVGEDLGIVEPVVRDEMAARGMLRFTLLYFEDADPSAFPRHALSAVTTHDLPTIAGLWSGADSAEMRALGVPVNDPALAATRSRLAGVALGDAVETVIVSAYRALAGSPSMLVAASLEDGVAVRLRPNVPGTTAALRANWSVALPRPLEDLLATPLPGEVAEALRRD